MTLLLAPGSLIQGPFLTNGVPNFEAVLYDPERGELRHFFRHNDKPDNAWEKAQVINTPAFPVLGAGAICQSNFGDTGNFEVVVPPGRVRIATDRRGVATRRRVDFGIGCFGGKVDACAQRLPRDRVQFGAGTHCSPDNPPRVDGGIRCYHVILRGDVPLGRAMMRIASRYARATQKRRPTTGHLFERRYRAILVDADSYLLELIRYIHLNPVRASIVSDPQDYPGARTAHTSVCNQRLG